MRDYRDTMTPGNAAGFFLLGSMMRMLPWVLPAVTGVHASDGNSTGVLWLNFMGLLLVSLGASRLLGPVVAAGWRRYALRPVLAGEIRRTAEDLARTQSH